MRIKSYFAGTVEAAIATARKELGHDAMLMNSRKAMPEARHLGEYEVVFAYPAAMEETPQERPEPVPDSLARELAELRREMQEISVYLQRAKSVAASNLTANPSLSAVFSSLIAAEVDASLAHTIVSAVRSRGTADPSGQMWQQVREEISQLVLADPNLGRRAGARRVVAMIGPPGAGKTTSLVKLAVRYGLSERRPTQILSMDLERIAAADQLHSFSAILGVGFQTVETTNALALALEEHRNKELVLIDTPGYGPKDLENTTGHVEMLARHTDIDVHLVVPATMKPADLTRTVEAFSGFRAHKLLFTHLDETRTFGMMLNESVRTGKPISFLCAGQQIPEDLEPASRARIVELLAGTAGRKAAAAAA